MVGMVIGLLGMIVMMQVFSVFEGQKRTTTGGSEAQNAGAIALYGLTRDIEQSGYGISSYTLIGCNVTLPANATRGAVTITAMAPVTINHALITASTQADANTDTLLIVSSNSNSSLEGNGITTTQADARTYAMQTPTSFNLNDMVITMPAARPAPCSRTVNTVVGVANPNVTLQNVDQIIIGGTLYNLGQTMRILAYAIRGGNLTVCDYMVNDCGLPANAGNTAIWQPIANNIVSMRVQYGHDATALAALGGRASYQVNTFDQTTPTTNCGWARTPAVRLALVTRSDQFNKTAVTAAAPVWAGSAAVPINLTGTANWQNYRYKIFETVMPLRNVTWQGVQTGC